MINLSRKTSRKHSNLIIFINLFSTMIAAWFYKNKASPHGSCRVLRWFSAYTRIVLVHCYRYIAIVALYDIPVESILDNKKGAEYPF